MYKCFPATVWEMLMKGLHVLTNGQYASPALEKINETYLIFIK